ESVDDAEAFIGPDRTGASMRGKTRGKAFGFTHKRPNIGPFFCFGDAKTISCQQLIGCSENP
ncbi:MAG: hypothetical protein FWD67_09540, partial [Betaproteobacteria bacterium]|nr:hypothetical protein [Betaproteobacteria bacterium]